MLAARATPLASSTPVTIVANNTRMRLISVPFHEGRGDQPRQLANATTLARGDEFPMNSW
jgi:hypothetical protein